MILKKSNTRCHSARPRDATTEPQAGGCYNKNMMETLREKSHYLVVSAG